MTDQMLNIPGILHDSCSPNRSLLLFYLELMHVERKEFIICQECFLLLFAHSLIEKKAN